jgi:hypothetical protein
VSITPSLSCDPRIPRHALPRWNAIQAELVHSFSGFGADPNARDVSRILRLENTTNNKNGELCQVLQETNTRYDFEVLSRELLPADRKKIRDKREQRSQRNQSSPQNAYQGAKSMLRPLGETMLNWTRLEDLRRLVELRGPVQQGMRDIFLYLAVSFMAWVEPDPGKLLLEIYELAREFVPSLLLWEIRSFTRSAFYRAEQAAQGQTVTFGGHAYDPRYRFTNNRLIELLKITPAEQRQLRTIISKEEAEERHRLRNRKLVDRATYLQTAEQRRIEALLRRAKGESIRQIADAMDIKKSRVQQILAMDAEKP